MGFGRPRCIAHQAAQAAGETFYHNGVPCKYGHIGPRYTSNHICVKCARLKRIREVEVKRANNERTRERNAIGTGDYGGVPRHAPLCAPEVVAWGVFPALMAGLWRKAA